MNFHNWISQNAVGKWDQLDLINQFNIFQLIMIISIFANPDPHNRKYFMQMNWMKRKTTTRKANFYDTNAGAKTTLF